MPTEFDMCLTNSTIAPSTNKCNDSITPKKSPWGVDDGYSTKIDLGSGGAEIEGDRRILMFKLWMLAKMA